MTVQKGDTYLLSDKMGNVRQFSIQAVSNTCYLLVDDLNNGTMYWMEKAKFESERFYTILEKLDTRKF